MPRPSPGCQDAASGWSPVTAKVALCIAQSRWPGAGRGGRRTVAAFGSRPAKDTGRGLTKVAAPPPPKTTIQTSATAAAGQTCVAAPLYGGLS